MGTPHRHKYIKIIPSLVPIMLAPKTIAFELHGTPHRHKYIKIIPSLDPIMLAPKTFAFHHKEDPLGDSLSLPAVQAAN